VQLTPTAAGAFLGVDGLGAVVHTQDQRSCGAEYDTQTTAFTPVLKNVNLAPGPTPLPGTRFYVSLHGSRKWNGGHCSSSDIEQGVFYLIWMMIVENGGLVKATTDDGRPTTKDEGRRTAHEAYIDA
jgi:hypothetical protein